MTEIATPPHRGRKVIHHRNELRNRQVAKQLHVFLATFLRDRLLLRCGRWCLRGLWHSQRVVKGRKIFSVGGRFGRAQVGNQHNRADTAQYNDDKAAREAEKVKAAISKLGTGPAARVEVKLKDRTKLKGYVSELNDYHFVVTDDKTGIATAVAYPQVKQVKGNNLSTGAKIAI